MVHLEEDGFAAGLWFDTLEERHYGATYVVPTISMWVLILLNTLSNNGKIRLTTT